MRTRTVAVIGVGASGTLVALHLLRAARAEGTALRLSLIDSSGRFGPGIAYATADPHHLLNTPAGKLGAHADDPGHFVRWAAGNGHGDDPAAFLPRSAYGQYLTQTLRAEARGADVEWLADPAVELSPGPRGGRVGLRSGRRLDVDVVVLALGAGATEPTSAKLPLAAPRYISAPWQERALDRISDDTPVLVVGTGLTMVDVALTLGRVRPRAVVHAVSRHGLLPRPHEPGHATGGVTTGPAPTAHTLTQLVRQIRERVAADPDRWREVVDELRPHAPELWHRLDVDDRRRFLSRLQRYWEVHRHRVAPVVDARLTELHRSGRVHVHAGRVLDTRADHDGFDVRLAVRGGERMLRVGWIVNATGFAPSLGGRPDPLIRRMLDDDVVTPDPLGLGIDTADDGRVVAGGNPQSWMFAVGALRRGTLFESTAVPEIRAQATAVATLALSDTVPSMRQEVLQ